MAVNECGCAESSALLTQSSRPFAPLPTLTTTHSPVCKTRTRRSIPCREEARRRTIPNTSSRSTIRRGPRIRLARVIRPGPAIHRVRAIRLVRAIRRAPPILRIRLTRTAWSCIPTATSPSAWIWRAICAIMAERCRCKWPFRSRLASLTETSACSATTATAPPRRNGSSTRPTPRSASPIPTSASTAGRVSTGIFRPGAAHTAIPSRPRHQHPDEDLAVL